LGRLSPCRRTGREKSTVPAKDDCRAPARSGGAGPGHVRERVVEDVERVVAARLELEDFLGDWILDHDHDPVVVAAPAERHPDAPARAARQLLPQSRAHLYLYRRSN